MDNAIPFDWAAFRDYFAGQTDVPTTDELKRFERCRRFIEDLSYGDADVAGRAMIDLADEFELEWRPAARLFAKLRHLLAVHSVLRRDEAYKRSALAVQDLERIRNSLAKLEKFSGSLLADDASVRAQRAKNLLQSAMHAWAHKRYGESRAAGQYERWEEAKAHGFVEAEGYDAHVVLDTWLRCNRLVEELVVGIIAEARKPIPSNDARTKGNVEPSSAIILAGVELPRLYERYTGKSYGFSTSSGKNDEGGGTLAKSGGPKFAVMCFRVMGLRPLSLKTLRVQWQSPEARRARRA